MTMIVQVSDLHLSRSHAWFQDNWDDFVDMMADERPDLILMTGDVAGDGPGRPDDLAFGAEQLARLPVRWRAIPGNHDAGDTPPDARNKQPLDEGKLDLFRRLIDADWWMEDIPHWRLIGLDAQLMGSNLPTEAEQWAFLDDALAGAAGRRIALFLHKPLFIAAPDETVVDSYTLTPEARARLMRLCADHDVAIVSSGHLHRYRSMRMGRTRLVWAPATSFLMNWKRKGRPLGRARLGYLRWRFTARGAAHEFVEPPLFVNLDVTNWNRHRGSTIHLPPRPLRSAASPAAGLRRPA